MSSWKEQLRISKRFQRKPGDSLMLVGGVNLLATLAACQVLLFVAPSGFAFALASLGGLLLVNALWPLRAHTGDGVEAWEAGINGACYLLSFALGALTLFILTAKLDVPPRLSTFGAMLPMVSLNTLTLWRTHSRRNRELAVYWRTQGTELRRGLAVALLLAVSLGLFFHRQITGVAIFPWDFQGGYHTNAFAWYTLGGFFSPPEWFAQGNFGFPAWSSLQDSAWFLPVSVMNFFDVPLSLPNIARLQVSLIFFAGMAVYALSRQLRVAYPAACFAAVAYALSSGFFSNEEHVDVIRGYALLPWLLLALHRNLACRRLGVVFAGLITFQYLVAAYPGQVVSAFYVSIAYVVWQCYESRREGKLALYIGSLAAAGLAGLLLCALKWWPVVVSHDMLTVDWTSSAARIYAVNLLTLFFRSDVGFLRGDATLRTMFLGAAVISLLFFLRRFGPDKRALTVMAAVSLVLGSLVFGHEGLVKWLPGVSVSRFQLLDYRGTFHLSLVLLAALVLDDWLSVPATRREKQLRIVVGLAFYAVMALLGRAAGWTLPDLVPLLLFALCLPLIAALAGGPSPASLWGLFGALWLLNLLSVHNHVMHIEENWNPDPYKVYEQRFYQGSMEKLLVQSRPEVWSYRPRRLVLPSDILSTRDSWLPKHPAYSRQWFIGGFAAFGADNVKRSVPHQALFDALRRDTNVPGRPLLAFMLNRSEAAVMDPALPFDGAKLTLCGVLQCGMARDARLAMTQFRLDGASYMLDTDTAVRVVENEMWYPGWSGQLTDVRRPGAPPESVEAEPFGPYLRSWTLPAGDWRLNTNYRAPGRGASWFMFWIGSVLLGIWSAAWPAFARHRVASG